MIVVDKKTIVFFLNAIYNEGKQILREEVFLVGNIEIKKQQFEYLKDAYKIFRQSDLVKFWLFAKHHCIVELLSPIEAGDS